jgi:hypothetical protein
MLPNVRSYFMLGGSLADFRTQGAQVVDVKIDGSSDIVRLPYVVGFPW